MCLRGVLRTPEEFRLKAKHTLNGSKKVSVFVFPEAHQVPPELLCRLSERV